MNINIVEMKRKTEIENNILKKINDDLNQCVIEIYDIMKNSIYDDNLKIFSNKYICLNSFLEKQPKNIDKKLLVNKLFTHAQQTYNAFQYFYMKKKDFMGMNLTGLIDGKIETGLGFRNCIIKFFFKETQIKYTELFELFEKELGLENNLIFYRIKSNTFKWTDFSLPIYDNYYIIYNHSYKKYYILFEN